MQELVQSVVSDHHAIAGTRGHSWAPWAPTQSCPCAGAWGLCCLLRTFEARRAALGRAGRASAGWKVPWAGGPVPRECAQTGGTLPAALAAPPSAPGARRGGRSRLEPPRGAGSQPWGLPAAGPGGENRPTRPRAAGCQAGVRVVLGGPRGTGTWVSAPDCRGDRSLQR